MPGHRSWAVRASFAPSEECALNAVTPSGFRDVLSEEARVREAITRPWPTCSPLAATCHRDAHPGGDGRPAGRPDGCPATPFKFFDSRGDLLAMRPDVTLQIARMCATRLAACRPLALPATPSASFARPRRRTRCRPASSPSAAWSASGKWGRRPMPRLWRSSPRRCGWPGATQFVLAMATVGVLRPCSSARGPRAVEGRGAGCLSRLRLRGPRPFV